MLISVLMLALGAASSSMQDSTARDAARRVVDAAMTRMGGADSLRAIRTMRMDLMTQWLRLDARPGGDLPSYERHTELRDYERRAWRNHRQFVPAGSATDIVADSIGARSVVGPNGQSQEVPLNIAYVTERRELFAFAPERTLLLARAAADLRQLRDTVVHGDTMHVVSATADGFPARWYVRSRDGLLAFVRFTADETDDFGLAPWGVMPVEVWFSGWTRLPSGVLLPRQRDVRRVGVPYKRMTALSLVPNAPAPADSFTIAPALAERFLREERRPMWAVALDTTLADTATFVPLPPQTGSSGAVRIGGEWLLLETGQAPGAVKRIDALLSARTRRPVSAGIVSYAGGNGGARWLAQQRRPVFVAPGARAHVAGLSANGSATRPVARERWQRIGTDSVLLVPVDLPDAPGTLAVYSPTLRWLYGPQLGFPVPRAEYSALVRRLRQRGFVIEQVGSVRGVRTAVPRELTAQGN